MNKQIENAAARFIREIKESEVYKRYWHQLEIIKGEPELYRQVNEFRKRNFEIQNTTQVNELFDKMDSFEKEYEKFRENSLVDDFLRCELAFCRLMQEIDIYITEELDFDLDVL